MLKTLKKYKAPYLFILPFFILFFVFQLVPTIWTFYISFTDWKGIGDPQLSGLGNYKKMMVDNMFWESLGNTVVYWLTGLVFILFWALLIACLLNSPFLKSNSERAFFNNVGLFNELLTMFGGSKIPWLTSTTYSKVPVIMLNVWRYTPWFTMILLSGLLNISKDYYEAATVDGANGIQQFWYITLPSLKNILFFCSVTLTVDMWKLFNESYILPGPGTSNTSLFQYMYESGFNVFNMGYASAIGVVLILILIVISVIQFIVRHKQGEI